MKIFFILRFLCVVFFVCLKMNNKKRRVSSKRSNTSAALQAEESQWVDLGKNKTSWIWKHFGVKTDGRAYCRYTLNKNGSEEECGWSCVYNSQTSSMNHHLGSVHKEYEQEKQVKKYYAN